MKKLIFISIFALCVSYGCQESCNTSGLRNLARALRDSDNDNWYDTTSNQRVDLFITQIVTIGGGGLIGPGRANVVVDDVMYNGITPSPGFDGNTVVASRFVGTWLLEGGDGPKTFVSRIKIFNGFASRSNDVSPLEVKWHNRDSTWTLNTNMGAITFRSQVTKFADPNPNDSLADTDGDGITEIEESLISRGGLGAGDITKRDIMLVVAHTHSDFSLRPFQKEQMVTVFFRNGFKLHVIEDATTLVGLRGGLIPNSAIDTLFTILEGNSHRTVANLRVAHVEAKFDSFTHFAVLQKEMFVPTDATNNGRSSGVPGLNLAMKSSLGGILGRESADFQGKLLMHEFGHNINLCHPITSPSFPEVCVALPPAEANNFSSVMGTPADDPNIIMNISNTLNRPFDYSPTQWSSGINLPAARNSAK